jgi:DNA invertase Pin-like site-specific DNA recombinase
LAEIERENISIRIKASKKIARDERRHQGGYLEFGYSKGEKGKLMPNEKEFEMLHSMFSLRKSGLGYRKISDEIKKKFGRKIHFPQVHKILSREHNQKLLEIS